MSRALNKPGLLGFTEHRVFYFTARIVSVIGIQRFVDGSVRKNNHCIRVRIVLFIRIMKDNYGIYRVCNKIIAVFVASASLFPVKTG